LQKKEEGLALDIEIPFTEDIKVAKIVLRGAPIGEIMIGSPTIDCLRLLVRSLSLSSSNWKFARLGPSRFVLFGLGLIDIENL
jgi:hypothetical protein